MQQATHPPHAGIVPSEQGPYRIVVRSIGTASPRLRVALRQILPLSEAQLLKLLYQAPSELISGIKLELAERMCEVLRGTGLEVEIQPIETPFTPGTGELEVAMVVRDVTRIPEVIAQVAELLDTDAATATRAVWGSPAMLIGHVSEATVDALRRRFTPLDVELDVSTPATAAYDLFLGPCDASMRAMTLRYLRDAGVPPFAPADGDTEAQPLLAVGLTQAEAQRIWERVQRSSAPVRILDQAFQRYDVRLDEASPSDALIDFLVEDTGMPRKVAPKVIQNTPVFLHQNVTCARARACLEGVARHGGRASAHLLTFQTFSLEIEAMTDRAATARLLSTVLGLPPEQALQTISRLPVHLEGPFTHLKARWLQQALQVTGARARLVMR